MKHFSPLMLAFLLCTSFCYASISNSEKAILLTIYKTTHGESWNQQWDLSKPAEEWHGVTIVDDVVVELNLSNNNLSGNLPQEIGLLSNLRELDVSHNNLDGEIPLDLKNLNQLETLLLNGNDFKRSIDVRIINIPTLTDYKFLEEDKKRKASFFSIKEEIVLSYE